MVNKIRKIYSVINIRGLFFIEVRKIFASNEMSVGECDKIRSV